MVSEAVLVEHFYWGVNSILTGRSPQTSTLNNLIYDLIYRKITSRTILLAQVGWGLNTGSGPLWRLITDITALYWRTPHQWEWEGFNQLLGHQTVVLVNHYEVSVKCTWRWKKKTQENINSHHFLKALLPITITLSLCLSLLLSHSLFLFHIEGDAENYLPDQEGIIKYLPASIPPFV